MFAPAILLHADKTRTEEKKQIEAKQREIERKRGESQYPLGSSFLCPLTLVVDTAEV